MARQRMAGIEAVVAHRTVLRVTAEAILLRVTRPAVTRAAEVIPAAVDTDNLSELVL